MTRSVVIFLLAAVILAIAIVYLASNRQDERGFAPAAESVGAGAEGAETASDTFDDVFTEERKAALEGEAQAVYAIEPEAVTPSQRLEPTVRRAIPDGFDSSNIPPAPAPTVAEYPAARASQPRLPADGPGGGGQIDPGPGPGAGGFGNGPGDDDVDVQTLGPGMSEFENMPGGSEVYGVDSGRGPGEGPQGPAGPGPGANDPRTPKPAPGD